MDPLALSLVLAGSLLHVGWNALAKSAEDKLAFLAIALLPWTFAAAGTAASLGSAIPAAGAACLAASCLLHALYFRALCGAYDEADLSFVYPYARGLGALTVAAFAGVLLGERLSALGWAGVALATTAYLAEPALGRKGAGAPARAWALTAATGILIGAYLLVDKAGLRHLPPGPYLLLLVGGSALATLPGIGIARLRAELARSRLRPPLASLFLAGAYGLILAAMARAEVSYVVAARASGIAASGAVGALLLSETVSGARWTAILLVGAGVACLAFA